MRLPMILTLLRMAKTFGATPRSSTLASVPVDRKGIGAISTASGVTKGPAAPRAMPGASWIILAESIVTLLVISDVGPARVMSALSAEPEETSVALNPRASDSMATKTPTVPAIPTTATIVEVQRALTLGCLRWWWRCQEPLASERQPSAVARHDVTRFAHS